MATKCKLCQTSEAMQDGLFCGYCDELIFNLKDMGWTIEPPKIKEGRTDLAILYRSYTKPKSHIKE